MSALASPRRREPAAPVDLARLRNRMADAIEHLIAAMDALDGDLEVEPSDDREDENEHGGDVNDEPHDDDVEAEPSLGAPENPRDQRRWAQGKP